MYNTVEACAIPPICNVVYVCVFPLVVHLSIC